MQELPQYPGFMTHRMKSALKRWENSTSKEFPSYDTLREQEIMRLWKDECEDAACQGILKAVKERYYVSTMKLRSWFFVTINPPETSDIDLLKFVKKIDKWSSSKMINSYEYCFEQRSDTIAEMGKGVHVHCLLTTDTNKADLIKRTAAMLKDFLPSENSVDVRYIGEDRLHNQRQYIRGVKVDEKTPKCHVDIYWRSKNNLLDIYTYNNADWEVDALQEESKKVQEENSDEASSQDIFSSG